MKRCTKDMVSKEPVWFSIRDIVVFSQSTHVNAKFFVSCLPQEAQKQWRRPMVTLEQQWQSGLFMHAYYLDMMQQSHHKPESSSYLCACGISIFILYVPRWEMVIHKQGSIMVDPYAPKDSHGDEHKPQRPMCFTMADLSFHSHGGTPIAGWFIKETPIKMDDLGVPPPLVGNLPRLNWHLEIPGGWEGQAERRRLVRIRSTEPAQESAVSWHHCLDCFGSGQKSVSKAMS